jgi:hypothetical protein
MLSINDLHNELLERQNKKHKIYEDVLEKIIGKIKYVNSKSNQCFLVYTLKNFIFGIPLYNINECGNYLQNRLSDAGFYARYNQMHNIYISWKTKPNKDKYLISHENLQPRLNSSIQYPTLTNNNNIKNEPNMLKLKKKTNTTLETKQSIFEEVDKKFLNINDNYNNIISSNNIPTNNIINNNMSLSNNNLLPRPTQDFNNIKTISYNNQKNNKQNIKQNNNKINNTQNNNLNDLDDFLGTLI